MVVIALRQIHITPPMGHLDVPEREAKLLVQIGYAKWPTDEAESIPPVAPTSRRRYRRRDLEAAD